MYNGDMSKSKPGFVVCALLAVLVNSARAANDNAVTVSVDERVELMSIIFRLAGNPEYNQGRLTSYLNDIDSHFGPHREHQVIQTAKKLRQTRGVSFDAVMSMAIHINDAFELQERVPIDDPKSNLDSRWRANEAREFLKQAREFVNDAKGREFFDQHRELYELTATRMQTMLKENADLAWFESFFGARPTARFMLVPGPVNRGQAYGPSIRLANGDEELFAIIGVWQIDDKGLPKFDRGVLPTVIHEFCHSFVNHLVDQHEDALRPAGETLYPLVAQQMKRQAYGNWLTMMRESVVRAAVICYLQAHDAEAARVQMEDDKQRGFVWMPKLVALLDEYQNDRNTWGSFDSFMPRIVKFFNESAPGMAEEIRKAEAEADGQRPKVVAVTPQLGAENVDPSTGFIIITFDRPMNTGGHSLMFGQGGKDAFPKVTFASFDKDGLVFTIKVQLEPNRRYEFFLNGDRGGNFKAADGPPLKQTPVQFSTGAVR
jgi:hypothetical protein